MRFRIARARGDDRLELGIGHLLDSLPSRRNRQRGRLRRRLSETRLEPELCRLRTSSPIRHQHLVPLLTLRACHERSPLGINGAAKHIPQELVVISQILGKLGSHIALFVPER